MYNTGETWGFGVSVGFPLFISILYIIMGCKQGKIDSKELLVEDERRNLLQVSTWTKVWYYYFLNYNILFVLCF
jgi:hypothetical protein